MNTIPFALTVILMSFSAAAFAQHEHAPVLTPAVPSEAQKAYEALKTLAGSWEGTLTPIPPVKDFSGARVKVVIRVTSRGNALMHEMTIAGVPDDPITMLYLDGDRLMLTHYCDTGNRPRMVAKTGPDGKTVTFEVLDISGSTQRGHMADAVFTILDPDHHLEEWTSYFPGGKRMTGRFELQRIKAASGPFGQ
jgi:hypothetical protein